MSNEPGNDAVKPTIIDLDAEDVTENKDKPAEAVDAPAESAKPAADPAPGKPAKNSNTLRNGAIAAGALVLAAVGGGWLYRDMLSPYFPSDQMTAVIAKAKSLEDINIKQAERLEGLERLTAQLKSDFDAIESKTAAAIADAKQTGETLTAASGRIDNVEAALKAAAQSINDLKTAAANAPATPGGAATSMPGDALANLALRIETLEKDVASLKAAGKSGQTDTAALSQSLSDLKAKLAAGTGYAEELARIQRMVPAAAGLDVLAASAPQGIPDAKALGQELTALAPQLPKPEIEIPKPEEQGMWSSFVDFLSSLITIRREGVADWQQAANAAAAFADSGDLPQALDYLNAIEDTKPAVLQQWMDKAATRLKAEAALKSVEEAVLRVIAAKG